MAKPIPWRWRKAPSTSAKGWLKSTGQVVDKRKIESHWTSLWVHVNHLPIKEALNISVVYIQVTNQRTLIMKHLGHCNMQRSGDCKGCMLCVSSCKPFSKTTCHLLNMYISVMCITLYSICINNIVELHSFHPLEVKHQHLQQLLLCLLFLLPELWASAIFQFLYI